jgi:ribonucleoside-triphosphate reductase
LGQYENYIALSRYARYLDEEGRRETWEETVQRYMDHVVAPALVGSVNSDVGTSVMFAVGKAIRDMEVLPSMRSLMTAGPALDRDNVAGYNCAYAAVDHPRVFDEALYILMCGTGFGFSVERQYVSKLPEVPELNKVETTIVVEDSKRGWAKALRKLVGALYAGDVPKYDLSQLRPHGARLKTFGGRASGPGPLRRLFDFVIATFKSAEGRKLTSYECHRILCKIGESVVAGGVRRSALISLSNLSDDRMRHAKDGRWFDTHPELSLANNSVAYTEKPEFDTFLRELVALNESKSGERGIFNRQASDKQASRNHRREVGREWGTNPCSEIILRPNQFCNLSSVVVRHGDTLANLLRKVELATILGTIQSTLTDFAYLRPLWKRNCEDERLLGVSLTGVMDHEVLASVGPEAKEWLTMLRAKAIVTNEEWSKKLGINQSTAITCVKPEGTVSQLTNSSSGLHPRYSQYYIRRVRGDVKDPISSFLKAAGVPWEEDAVQPGQVVFSFPVKSPEGAITRNEVSALEQLEHWKMMQEHWCEHKPSITVYYSPDEFLAVGQWVWDNFDIVSGVSFLPRDNGGYLQAPYEEISREEYEKLVTQMPTIPWDLFREDGDYTTGAQNFACISGACEL